MALAILPHEIYDSGEGLNQRIVGTGPFQLDAGASQPGSRWVWKKNPTYWDPGKPYIDELDMLVLPDDATTYSAFQSKRLDMLTNNIGISSAEQIKQASPNAVIYEYLANTPGQIWMNQRAGALLGDERLRQSIGLCIDRDEFIKALAGGKGAWALAGAFPDTFSQQEVRQILRYAPAQAKQLLSSAGYPNGLDMEFIYPGTTYGETYVSQIQLLQAQLKRVGINLSLKAVDASDASKRRQNGAYTISMTPKTSLGTDVDSWLYTSFYTGSVSNYAGLSDAGLDKLLDAQRREVDPIKRKDIIRQAVRSIADHAYSFSLYDETHAQFWQPYLKGYAPNEGNPGEENCPRLEYSWLEKN